MRIPIFFLTASLGLAGAHGQSLVINELMQSNIDCVMAEHDFPDSWVELYNPTSQRVNTEGWVLSIKGTPDAGYVLPPAYVAPNGHLMVYCDKESRGFHTDFRLDSGKGSVTLYTPDGETADAVSLKKMPAPNVAYARVGDGGDSWHYAYTPTPGTENIGSGAMTVLPQPSFSLSGGLYTDLPEAPLVISIPADAPGRDNLIVRYTTDGREPTLQDAGGQSVTLPITATTAVRAKIFARDGQGVPAPSVTQSYIFHPRAVKMPIVALTTDEAYFYSAEEGILADGDPQGLPNYQQSWRRPLNIEYYDPEAGGAVLNQLGEVAVSGESTRILPQKSLKVYAHKRFGTKNFSANLWPDKPQVTEVKSFVLRSGGNNSPTSRINDALVQTLFGTHVENLDWQAYRPVIVYLNGKYLGEFGLRERSNEDYVAANYGGLEDIEMADADSYQTPEEGSLFEDFFNYYHGPVSHSGLDERMDLDNFLKALACEMYGMNTDFPTNNVSMWRPLDGAKLPEGAASGKWRWILKDLDRFAMPHPLYAEDFNMVRYLFAPDELQYSGMHHFDLYSRIASIDGFIVPFLDFMAVSLGDFLRPDYAVPFCDAMVDEIFDEIAPTYDLYGYKMSDFIGNVEGLRQFITHRPAWLYPQLAEFFGTGRPIPMTVTTGGYDVEINTIPLKSGQFDGQWFANRPLCLVAPEGCTWRITVRREGFEQVNENPAPTLNWSMSAWEPYDDVEIDFEVLPGNLTAVSAPLKPVTDQVGTASATYYDLFGRRVSDASTGIMIKRENRGTKKISVRKR